MGKQILKNLEEHDPELVMTQIDLIVAPIFELQKEYYETLLKFNVKTFLAGYSQGERLVNRRTKEMVKSTKADVNFFGSSLFGTNPTAAARLRDDAFEASERTMQRVDSSITKTITEYYEEGVGSRPLGQAIQKKFDKLASYESERIARTEMHSAHEFGKNEAFQNMDIQYVEWSTHVDNRTRSQHIDINGEIKPIDGVFSNDLKYPGDKNGIPSEVINCRCTTMPFLMPPGKMAPPGMATFKEGDLVDIPQGTIRTKPTVSGMDKFKLTSEETINLKKLREAEKLKFKEKSQLKLLEDKQKLNKLHNKFLSDGKLSADETKAYLKVQGNLNKKLKLDKLYSEEELLNKPKTAKIINKITKKREETPLEKNLKKLSELNTSKLDGRKFTNFTSNAEEKVISQVKLQNLNKKEIDTLNIWSGDSHKLVNKYCRGETITLQELKEFNFKSLKELEKEVNQLTKLIDGLSKNKALQEDTILWRGVSNKNVDLSKFKVGKVNKFGTFSSTSFDVDVAADFAEYADGEGYILKIHAPKGTLGGAIDDSLSNAPGEMEYLLSRNQKYETINVDKKLRIIEVVLRD